MVLSTVQYNRGGVGRVSIKHDKKSRWVLVVH